MTPITAIIKMYWNGCTQQQHKFLSIYVTIPESNPPIKTTLYISLFVKNIKDAKGQSLKKSFKLTPSNHKLEGGIREFLPLTTFDTLLQHDSIVTFGVLIKKTP